MVAEDIIVLQNGDIVKAKVIEIGQTEVKYRKISNLNGPIYSINKNEIFSISYENGEKEVFNDNPTKHKLEANSDSQNSVTVVSPAEDNDNIISEYNQYYSGDKEKKIKNGLAKEFSICWYFTPQSVLSSDDVIVSFEIVNIPHYGSHYIDDYEDILGEYKINISNRSSEPIFIDLANTMRVDFDASIHPFYTGGSSSIQGGSGGGAGINVGSITNLLGIGGAVGTIANGLNLNSNKHNGATLTVGEQQVLTILPNTTLSLPMRKVINKKRTKITDHFENFKFGDYMDTWDKRTPEISKLQIKKNEIREIDFQEKPFSIQYYITYSKNRDFSNSYVIPLELYPGVIDASKSHYSKISDKIKLFY